MKKNISCFIIFLCLLQLFVSCTTNVEDDFDKLIEKMQEKQAETDISGGTGNTSGVCASSYKGSVGDAQLDAFCKAAYAYRCKDNKPLTHPQVKATCDTYEDMKEPGVAKCNYCQ